jgi:hypothetical protein
MSTRDSEIMLNVIIGCVVCCFTVVFFNAIFFKKEEPELTVQHGHFLITEIVYSDCVKNEHITAETPTTAICKEIRREYK